MPPKKKKANGYSMYMLAERQRIQAETKQMPSMQEMAAICTNSWNKLSSQDRARYNAMAKQHNGKEVDLKDPDRHRLDNQGQIIADRKSAIREVANRRTQENQLLVKSWQGKDVLDLAFHMINFQVMYTEEPVDYFLPLEVGLVCFTLRDGIIKHEHHFIDPGDVPLGCMHLALSHSENTHKIPIHFKEAESNYLELWMQISKFVVDDDCRHDVPPIFCLLNDRNIVESCLEFIHDHARIGEDNIFTKIYVLEDLAMSLLLQSGKVHSKPSETQIQDSLLRNQWDYISGIRCSFHDEIDCSYCSLAIVRRVSFALFDMLSNILDFKLKENHMPDETSNTKFTVVHPTVRDARINDHRNKYDNTSRSTSPRNLSDQAPSRVRGMSRISQVEVKQSDSDDDEEELKAASDDYFYTELRKPKSPAVILRPTLPVTGLAYGRGLTLPASIGLQNHQNSIRPPPGFGPRPGITESIVRPQVSVRPILGNIQTQTALARSTAASSHGRGWETGRGRGRGMPPQG